MKTSLTRPPVRERQTSTVAFVDPLLPDCEKEWASPHLHVMDQETVDLDAAARAVKDLLAALGQDPESHHLSDTPRRVAAAYAESLCPEPFALTTFPNDEGYDELVVVSDFSPIRRGR